MKPWSLIGLTNRPQEQTAAACVSLHYKKQKVSVYCITDPTSVSYCWITNVPAIGAHRIILLLLNVTYLSQPKQLHGNLSRNMESFKLVWFF